MTVAEKVVEQVATKGTAMGLRIAGLFATLMFMSHEAGGNDDSIWNEGREQRFHELQHKKSQGTLTQQEKNELNDLYRHWLWYTKGGREGERAGSYLSNRAIFNRGSRNFKLEQGNASSGWKHIYDRHINPSRFPKKTKFDPNLSESDIKRLLNKTLKHGKESNYDGLPVFEYRTKTNGTYRKYRATVNTDGTVRTFHPLE